MRNLFVALLLIASMLFVPITALADDPPPTVPPDCKPALVIHVVDGDTIHVRIDGYYYKLRYIGIDTPETVDPRRPVGRFGKEASAYNKALVDGQEVCLEKDVSEVDRYGRLLRYVWLGETMVNAEMVAQGYAYAKTYPPDVRHTAYFRQLQAEAREASRGLWGLQ